MCCSMLIGNVESLLRMFKPDDYKLSNVPIHPTRAPNADHGLQTLCEACRNNYYDQRANRGANRNGCFNIIAMKLNTVLNQLCNTLDYYELSIVSVNSRLSFTDYDNLYSMMSYYILMAQFFHDYLKDLACISIPGSPEPLLISSSDRERLDKFTNSYNDCHSRLRHLNTLRNMNK